MFAICSIASSQIGDKPLLHCDRFTLAIAAKLG